jgi:NAD(P)-dependent dehydrogenase (short-subunit alcohol dehydrogenase family)
MFEGPSLDSTGSFAHKVAVVTGGGSGIGLAAARALASAGATAILYGSDEAVLTRAAQELGTEGLRARAVVGDVSNSASVRSLLNLVDMEFKRLDFIVNSAAIQPYGTVETMDEKQWDRVLAINLKGIYLTGHYGIPLMRKTGGGSIVNVASVQGLACQTNLAAYVASKGAVLALTRSMALDCAKDGIRVNSVCPGSIDTPMLRFAAADNRGSGTPDDVIKQWGSAHPIGRVGRAEEVGAMIAFLCSSGAGFCTGGQYLIDGGLLARLGVSLPE